MRHLRAWLRRAGRRGPWRADHQNLLGPDAVPSRADPGTYPLRNPALSAGPGKTLVYVVGQPRAGLVLDGYQIIVRARDTPRYGFLVLPAKRDVSTAWRLVGEELTGNQVFEVRTRCVDWASGGTSKRPRSPVPSASMTGSCRNAQGPSTIPHAPESPSAAVIVDACRQVTAARRALARHAGWPGSVLDTAIVATPFPQAQHQDGRWIVGTVEDATIDQVLQVYVSEDLHTILVDSPASDANRRPWWVRRDFPSTRDGAPHPAYRYWIAGVASTPEEAYRHVHEKDAGDVDWAWNDVSGTTDPWE